jgi:hypothetical protein
MRESKPPSALKRRKRESSFIEDDPSTESLTSAR